MNITLSQKEKTLLQDQKSHEELCIEKYSKYANQTQDSQLKQLFNTNEKAERTHLDSINQLLSGSIPSMNSQGGQSGMSQQSQGMQLNMNEQNPNPPITGAGLSDKDMCSDLLMTEKYVSGTYDTTIFECADPRVRDVLNHIQKEEQKHGEAIFSYMQSRGMYNVQ